GLVVHFTAELGGRRFNPEVETVVYRICQESLLNALKYADVDELEVRLFTAGTHLELTVVDQGNGFQVGSAESAKGTGLGLYGMEERAELVHGEVSIQSAPGAGTTVQLRVPVEPLSM